MHCVQKNARAKKGIQGKKAGVRMKQAKESTSKFIKVRCPKYKNEQIMFGKASTTVNCLVCNKVVAEPTGGKARIKARVLEVLE